MASKTYKHGLPFDTAMRDCLDEQIKERINRKFPSLIIVDGGQGQGKTTFLVHCIDYVNSKYKLGDCTLENKEHPQLAQGGKEFKKCFNLCKEKKLPILGYDEAGDFSRRGAITSFNWMLNRTFETFRSSGIIIFLCLPNFNILDNHLFDLEVPRVLLHMRDRQITINCGNYSAYSLYGMNWIRYWFEKLPKAIRYKCYDHVTPNFRGHFLNLSESRAEKLAKLSDSGKAKQDYLAEVRMNKWLNYEDLCQKLGRSRIWVVKEVNRLKIKPARLIMGKKYFDSITLNRLHEILDSRRGVR